MEENVLVKTSQTLELLPLTQPNLIFFCTPPRPTPPPQPCKHNTTNLADSFIQTAFLKNRDGSLLDKASSQNMSRCFNHAYT